MYLIDLENSAQNLKKAAPFQANDQPQESQIQFGIPVVVADNAQSDREQVAISLSLSSMNIDLDDEA